jgi:hypothetical protein
MHPYETSQRLPDKDCRVRVVYQDGRTEVLWWNPRANVQAFWRRDETGSLTVWWRWLKSFEILPD